MLRIMIYLLRLKLRLSKHIFRRGRGIFKLLFTIDDFIRIFAMTLFFAFLSRVFNLGRTFTILLVLLGVYIDFHDFMYDHKIGKIELR